MASGSGFQTASQLLVLCILVTWCTASFDASTRSQIDDVIEAGMRCRGIPGLALAVVRDGKVLMSKGYGVKNQKTQQAVTSDTLFQIASLTKAFTSALLSNILAADSHLTISTTLHSSDALPASFRFNNSLRTTYATIEDLLAHRTGVPRNNFIRLALDYDINTVVDKIGYLPSVGGFRDSFYYNDLMYGLAAHLTEKLGNHTWEQQVRDAIFSPLGMTRSTFISEVDFVRDDVASPYVVEGGNYVQASNDFIKHWGKNTGSGSIFSTANDMAKWMLLLLNDGKASSGGRVLREGVLGEVFKPSNVVPPASYAASYRRPVTPVTFSGDTYGLGWKMGYYRGYKMFYHSGTTFGYGAFLTLLPEMNVGVVSMLTGNDYQYKFRTPLHEYVMDEALGLAPWINSTSICTFPDPWKSAHSPQPSSDEEDITEDEEALIQRPQRTAAREARLRPSTLALDAYTGTFHHGAYGDLTVRLNSVTHSLELQYGVGLWRLDSTVDSGHFHGHWLRDVPSLPMDFVFHSEGQRLVSVEAPGFEKAQPPVFFRKAQGSSGPLIG